LFHIISKSIGEKSMDEKIAARIIKKYMRKGGMARCLRDILPSAGLSREQREETAEIVHDVVRWKKLYDHLMNTRGLQPNPETYVDFARNNAHLEGASYPFEYRYSCSAYVASVLETHPKWAEYLNQRPPTSLCVNLNTSSPQKIIDILHTEKITAEPSVLATTVLTSSMGRYSRVIEQRLAHVQDEASQYIASLAVELGQSVLDYCAGNGGKSLAMASMSQNNKTLTAYEVNPAKREILHRRLHEHHAHVSVEDHPPRDTYDVVLADAPCTGLGAARRNPEAKYVEGPDDFPAIQQSILHAAAQNVHNGGYLLYAVCTITPEETTDVIEAFVRDHQFEVAPLSSLPYKEYLHPTSSGAYTMFPQGDLFFVSLLKKNE
jgi:16S rRNA (cytosine967-C5)-methyltransferase